MRLFLLRYFDITPAYFTSFLIIFYGNSLWNEHPYSLLAIWFIAIGSLLVGFNFAITLTRNDMHFVYICEKKLLEKRVNK
jgi:hypothetical protein